MFVRVRQEHVPEDFQMVVPILLDFGDAGTAVVKVLVRGPLTEAELPLLPMKPSKVEFNPFEAVLAETKTVITSYSIHYTKLYERTLVASCIRPVAEGMKVKTATERAEKSRKLVAELLVADQPARDTAHDRSSHFWDMAEANGVATSRFPKLEETRVPLLDASHVAMRVNLDACIHCNLCVRACREVQVNVV